MPAAGEIRWFEVCSLSGAAKAFCEARAISDVLVAPVRVGRGSTTGAGAVVTRDIPPDSLAVGVPARVVGSLTKTPKPATAGDVVPDATPERIAHTL